MCLLLGVRNISHCGTALELLGVTSSALLLETKRGAGILWLAIARPLFQGYKCLMYNESCNERPNKWCFLQFYIPRGADSIGHFDTASSQAITLACFRKRFYFRRENLTKGPERTLCFLVAALNSICLCSTLKKAVGLRAVTEHLWAGIGPLEVWVWKGEQEGICKVSPFSIGKKRECVRPGLLFCSVGYHQPRVKLTCFRCDACSGLPHAYGGKGLADDLSPWHCLVKTSLWRQHNRGLPAGFSTLF